MLRLGAFAPALLALTAPALAEDWRKIEHDGNVMEVDADSIRDEGGQRRFRARIGLNANTVLLTDNIVACMIDSLEMQRMETFVDGKLTETKDFAPGERRQMVTDPAGMKLLELVCA